MEDAGGEGWFMVSSLESSVRGGGGRLKEGGSQDSTWWRSMCSIREGLGKGVGRWFDNNIRRVVGDGNDTLSWQDI